MVSSNKQYNSFFLMKKKKCQVKILQQYSSITLFHRKCGNEKGNERIQPGGSHPFANLMEIIWYFFSEIGMTNLKLISGKTLMKLI